MKSWPGKSATNRPSRRTPGSSHRTPSTRYAKTTRRHSEAGIHNRRDKRFPLTSPRTAPVDFLESPVNSESENSREDQMSAWREAVMLWLSWNSTHERLTAKMYQSGQDQAKIMALMDEMDQLRRQAICLSEELLRAV